MKNKSKKLTSQQMYKEINRIASFNGGYNWLLKLAHRHKYDIQELDELPIETWIDITHIECNRRREKARNTIGNDHQRIFPKSQGKAAPYTGFVRIISTPMGGQNKRY